MIRRIVWLLIILWIAYWIYKAVDPQWAESLVVRIQSYFSSDNEVAQQWDQSTGDVISEGEPTVASIPQVYTWDLSTGSLVELDYVLWESSANQSEAEAVDEEPLVITESETKVQPTTKTTTTTSSSSKKGLSTQDMNDTKALLQAIVE